jgi:hypothetical protein
MVADNLLASDSDEALTISERIKPLLAVHSSALQGTVLADLVSIWLAEHPAAIREVVLQSWLVSVNQLIPLSAMEIRASRRTN